MRSEVVDISLEPARPADSPLLSNLLELYIHDLSDVFQVETGADGRYGYGKLPLYWSEPDCRFPFLIRFGDRVVGFALVTRGSPAADDPHALDVAEFFVLRRYRRFGVGRAAARLLWNRIAGHWTVRVSEGNRGGLAFWRPVVDDYTRGAFRESMHPGSPHPWRVYAFESSGLADDGTGPARGA